LVCNKLQFSDEPVYTAKPQINFEKVTVNETALCRNAEQ